MYFPPFFHPLSIIFFLNMLFGHIFFWGGSNRKIYTPGCMYTINDKYNRSTSSGETEPDPVLNIGKQTFQNYLIPNNTQNRRLKKINAHHTCDGLSDQIDQAKFLFKANVSLIIILDANTSERRIVLELMKFGRHLNLSSSDNLQTSIRFKIIFILKSLNL